MNFTVMTTESCVFENRAFDWQDLKMFESIVSALSSDWFSKSGWPRFQ